MTNVDLRQFVDIDIQRHVSTNLVGTRDTVVIFTAYGPQDPAIVEIKSMTEAEEYYKGKTGAEKLLAYLEVYFENKGNRALVYEGYSEVASSDITNLEDKYICIAFTDLTYQQIEELAIELQNNTDIYGIKEKLLFARTESLDNPLSVKNLVVKYSTVLGAEMTMAAYLSNIDVYGTDTIQDYCFTQETIPEATITTEQYEQLIEDNVNVDIILANAVRNCGGNCKNGYDLTNNFVRIVLHQTLTDRLIALLTQKIKSNSGLGKIYTVISQEMNKYLNSGYLTTDKIWTYDDLIVNKDNKSYTIIEKGTALTTGYLIKILPISSLSEEQLSLREAPDIYLIIADQYGIRKITINGKII